MKLPPALAVEWRHHPSSDSGTLACRHMSDLVISYAREDRAFVEKLVAAA